MKICVDPQGNFTQATLYHEELAVREPEKFNIHEVPELVYKKYAKMKAENKDIRFVDSNFVVHTNADALKELRISELYAEYVKDKETLIWISLTSDLKKVYGVHQTVKAVEKLERALILAGIRGEAPLRVLEKVGDEEVVVFPMFTLDELQFFYSACSNNQIMQYNLFKQARKRVQELEAKDVDTLAKKLKKITLI